MGPRSGAHQARSQTRTASPTATRSPTGSSPEGSAVLPGLVTPVGSRPAGRAGEPASLVPAYGALFSLARLSCRLSFGARYFSLSRAQLVQRQLHQPEGTV